MAEVVIRQDYYNLYKKYINADFKFPIYHNQEVPSRFHRYLFFQISSFSVEKEGHRFEASITKKER
jgi:hypothetical protein